MESQSRQGLLGRAGRSAASLTLRIWQNDRSAVSVPTADHTANCCHPTTRERRGSSRQFVSEWDLKLSVIRDEELARYSSVRSRKPVSLSSPREAAVSQSQLFYSCLQTYLFQNKYILSFLFLSSFPFGCPSQLNVCACVSACVRECVPVCSVCVCARATMCVCVLITHDIALYVYSLYTINLYGLVFARCMFFFNYKL